MQFFARNGFTWDSKAPLVGAAGGRFGTPGVCGHRRGPMTPNVNKRVRERNGQLRLTNIKPQIFEVFVITKLNKLFKITQNRPEALASFT